MGIYLGRIGMGAHIGKFFAIQGIVSLFMPTLIGIIADRWVPAQKMLGICHFLAAVFMALAGYMGMKYGNEVTFGQIFPYYALSVAFFMPTIALGNSVSYNALTQAGLDTVKAFPPIRVFGTIGFILSMWIVNFTGFKDNYMQLFISAAWGIILAVYAFTLPNCPVNKWECSRGCRAGFSSRQSPCSRSRGPEASSSLRDRSWSPSDEGGKAWWPRSLRLRRGVSFPLSQA